MNFIWNGLLSKMSRLLDINGKRELFWYGITVGQVGFGVLVSRECQPTPHAADGANADGEAYRRMVERHSMPGIDSNSPPRR